MQRFLISCVLSASSAGIFLALVSRTRCPLTPDLAKTLTDHIFHFYFPPLKGIIWIVFLFILVISCISYQFFPQGSGLLIVLRSMLEVLDNFSASTDLYTLKYFCRVFELLFVSRLRLSYFLSQI